MSQAMWKNKKILLFSFVTAATTVIAGILHLLMVPDSLSYDLKAAILFLIGGILQVFWAVPVIWRWGKMWQVIGIVGTVIFFALWYASMLNLIPMSDTSQDELPQDELPQDELPQDELPQDDDLSTDSAPPEIGLEIGGILVPPIEMFQIAFIGLYAVLAKLSKKQ